jgi:hypothetical protein
MRNKIVILENGSREEACKRFDEVKSTITDFAKESVSIRGNIRNSNEGWNVIKSYR